MNISSAVIFMPTENNACCALEILPDLISAEISYLLADVCRKEEPMRLPWPERLDLADEVSFGLSPRP